MSSNSQTAPSEPSILEFNVGLVTLKTRVFEMFRWFRTDPFVTKTNLDFFFAFMQKPVITFYIKHNIQFLAVGKRAMLPRWLVIKIRTLLQITKDSNASNRAWPKNDFPTSNRRTASGHWRFLLDPEGGNDLGGSSVTEHERPQEGLNVCVWTFRDGTVEWGWSGRSSC